MSLEDIAELQDALREFIREELAGVYTMHLVVVREYDAERQRCVVALKDDPDAQIDNVPIATPLAGPDYGDIYPITPGETEGICLFSRVPLDDLLTHRGPQGTPQHRRHAVEDAVFLPAMVFYDDDDVPAHDPGDRLIVHPAGSLIRLAESGAVTIETADGPRVRLDAADGLTLTHGPVTVALDDAGVAIETGEDAGVETGVTTLGRHDDPDRVEMVDHRHLVEHDDGTYDVTGPPLTHREMFRYLLGAAQTADLSNPTATADAQERYAHWLDWLERAIAGYGAGGYGAGGYGRTPLDPATGAWPDPEPQPTPAERDSFDGTITVRGVGVASRLEATAAAEAIPGWPRPSLDDL